MRAFALPPWPSAGMRGQSTCATLGIGGASDGFPRRGEFAVCVAVGALLVVYDPVTPPNEHGTSHAWLALRGMGRIPKKMITAFRRKSVGMFVAWNDDFATVRVRSESIRHVRGTWPPPGDHRRGGDQHRGSSTPTRSDAASPLSRSASCSHAGDQRWCGRSVDASDHGCVYVVDRGRSSL